MRLNFLEVCLSPDFGGLELCVIDYFNYFKTKGITKIVVAPNTKLDEHLESEHKILLTRNKFFPFMPALKLAKVIDENAIDIIHFHWTRDITTLVLAKLLSKKKPKLVQSRHMNMTRFKGDFYHKWLYENIDMIHAVTQQVKAQLQKYIPQDIRPQIEKVYLGVDKPLLDLVKVQDLEKKYALEHTFVVGIVGRIEEAKGQYLLIKALAILKNPHIKVLIIGHSMDEKYLLSLKRELRNVNLEAHCIFTGFTQHVNEHMKLCDVTVLATKKETFGLVVIESMVNEVPVIATNAGGPLEIIEDEKDGLLFDGSAEDLAQKITLVYEDRVLQERLAHNAYEKVMQNFNKERQMQKMYEVLSK